MSTDRPLQDFLAEAEDILNTANGTLLGIDEGVSAGHAPDPDRVNALFRAVHSYKGLAGMFGLQAIAELAHKLESLLDETRLGKAQLSRDLLDVLFDTLALFDRLMQQAAKNEQPDDITTALERIERALKAPSSSPSDQAILDRVELDRGLLHVLTEYEEHRLKENIRERKNLIKVKAAFQLADFEGGIKGLTAALKKLGETICTLPTTGASGSEIAFTILVGTGEGPESLAQKLGMPSVAIEAVPYRDRAAAPGEPKREAVDMLRTVSNTVRVDIYKLDGLMNTVGDMHLTKNAIGRIARELKTLAGFSGLGVDMMKVHRKLERQINELQDRIIDVRMVPIGHIFTRLAQMVRKYARDADKEIDLQMAGEETELDKVMIEDLADPLMHLIRNAVDHGIESPEVRRQRGKPEHGIVRLTAYPQGNQVVIEIEDDGNGMDPAALLRTAAEKGLIEPDHGLDTVRDRKEVLDLIFLPGFTTRQTVTEISGRGVGMDVVKKNITRLSGIIDIETEPGAGTKFVLTLPITLAIIKALVIEAGGQMFAVPLGSVLEVFRTAPGQVETVENREVIAVRGETVSLFRLSQAFNLPMQETRGMLYVILVGLAERRLGIVVDRIRDEQEIIIKTLGKRLADTPGIAGATELGDKRIVLVVDVESLMAGAFKKAAARA